MSSTASSEFTPFSPICDETYKKALMRRLEQNAAVVISSSDCPACDEAKSILEENKVGYKEIVLD